MCDYSLENVKSRPAAIGDKLQTKRFGFGAGTTGFADPASPVAEPVVVCLRPGTELAFDDPVAISALYGTFTQTQHKVAIFRQVNVDRPLTHHDCLEFENGTTVFLNDLQEGQSATVLQLPAEALPEKAKPEPVLDRVLETIAVELGQLADSLSGKR